MVHDAGTTSDVFDEQAGADGPRDELDAVVGLLDELRDRVAHWEDGTLAGDSPAAEENRTIRGAQAALARNRSWAFRDELVAVRERAVAVRRSLREGVRDGRLPARHPDHGLGLVVGVSAGSGSGSGPGPADVTAPPTGAAAGRETAGRYGDRLAAALDRSARALMRPETVDDALGLIVQGACLSVPHADRAGVSLLEGDGLTARAPTDDTVSELDELQARFHEGPCWDAARTQDRVVVTELGDAGDRWPRFAGAASDRGVRSIAAFPLFGKNGPAGALNLYGDVSGAFDNEDLDLGGLFASQASLVLRGAQRMDGLNSALRSRDVIGQAKGILIERFSLDPDAAFAMLVRSSQDVNLKLTEVARWVVSETTGVPVERL